MRLNLPTKEANNNNKRNCVSNLSLFDPHLKENFVTSVFLYLESSLVLVDCAKLIVDIMVIQEM